MPLALVEIQRSSQPVVTNDGAVIRLHSHGNDQTVFESSMIALSVVVLDIFAHSTVPRCLLNEDHPIQTFVLEGRRRRQLRRVGG
jgi:hypothetical protein